MDQAMPTIFPGRYTAETDEPFVVFLIGMRINRLRAVNKWLPTMRAMPGMLEELYRQPELGLMHAQLLLGWRVIYSVQYWRSFEQLEAYSRSREYAHLPAWQAFRKSIGDDGSVGIFHETYRVEPGSWECVYGNMPAFGLAQAASHQRVGRRTEQARDRMYGQSTIKE
jgi:hypothetical protein